MNSKFNKTEILIMFCVLTCIAHSTSAFTFSNLLCPTNNIQKRNNLQEQNVALPPTLTYSHSCVFKNGNNFNEMSVRIENKRVILAVVYKELNIVQQYKDYTTLIQLVGIKNQVVIIKVFSADKSSFTYDVLRYDGTKTSSPQIAITWGVTLPWISDAGSNSLVGLSIKKLLNYNQQNFNLSMIVSSTTTAYFYFLKFDTGALTRKASIVASALPSIIGGYQKLIFDDVSNKFYSWSTGNTFNYEDLTSFLIVVPFYYNNVVSFELQNSHVFFLSKDTSSFKASLVSDKNGERGITYFNTGTIQVRYHCDRLMNLIIFSDQMIFWNSKTQFTPNTDVMVYQTKGNTFFAGIDEIISDFSTSLSVSTNSQTAFVLTADSMKFFKIYVKTAVLNAIQKTQQLFLTDSMKTQIAATNSGQLLVVTLKCQCASDAIPHMVCFSQTYSCIIAMRKDFVDCTTYSP